MSWHNMLAACGCQAAAGAYIRCRCLAAVAALGTFYLSAV